MIICRYDLKGGPVGTARVTDATTVAELQNAVNSASQRLTTNPCEIDSVTYVFFTAGTRAAFFTFDLTSCKRLDDAAKRRNHRPARRSPAVAQPRWDRNRPLNGAPRRAGRQNLRHADALHEDH